MKKMKRKLVQGRTEGLAVNAARVILVVYAIAALLQSANGIVA